MCRIVMQYLNSDLILKNLDSQSYSRFSINQIAQEMDPYPPTFDSVANDAKVMDLSA